MSKSADHSASGKSQTRDVTTHSFREEEKGKNANALNEIVLRQQRRIKDLEGQLVSQKLRFQELTRSHTSLLNSRLGKISNIVSRSMNMAIHGYEILKPSHLVTVVKNRMTRLARPIQGESLKPPKDPCIDIIIPVYKGFDETKACLESLLLSEQSNPIEIIVINDCSPDEELVLYLNEKAENGLISLLSNKENLGFVGTVNRGMQIHPGRDVILLNSDTEVCGNWVDRMKACAYSAPRAGSVTPFSNNATICSYPHFCEENELPDDVSVGEFDRVFRQINREQPGIEIPTAVGFCMYIKRACLEDVGGFDQEAFGLGYGEENDFCMRAIQRGWHHLLSPNVFVYHSGGVSFSEIKFELMNRAMKILEKRYPTYHFLVHKHIANDPASGMRQDVSRHRLSQIDLPKILFIYHGGIGGVERHMNELVEILEGKAEFLVLGPEGKNAVCIRWESSMKEILGQYSIPEDFDQLIGFLKQLDLKRIHIHHTMDLHPKLWQLAKELGVPLDYTLHDYYPLVGNPKMVDSRNQWVSNIDDRYQKCLAKSKLPMEPGAFVQTQLDILKSSERIIAPSDFTAQLYREHAPELNVLTVRHSDLKHPTSPAHWPVIRKPQITNFRILVLGALGPEKGADLLEKVARISVQKALPIEYHLLGYAYRWLDESVLTYGEYQEDDLLDLIQAVDPHLIWFPAQWPETYCYTLSASLLSERPIVAPNIGAFPERLVGREWTWIEPWDRLASDWVLFFEQIRTDWSTNVAAGFVPKTTKWDECSDDNTKSWSYRKDYLMDPNDVKEG